MSSFWFGITVWEFCSMVMTIDRTELCKAFSTATAIRVLKAQAVLRNFSQCFANNNPGLFPVVTKGSVLQCLAAVVLDERRGCRDTLPLWSIEGFSFLTGFTEDEGSEHLAGQRQAKSWCCINVNGSKLKALLLGEWIAAQISWQRSLCQLPLGFTWCISVHTLKQYFPVKIRAVCSQGGFTLVSVPSQQKKIQLL